MDRKKHQGLHKPEQHHLQVPKTLPDYTKECHRTIRKYICTHRRLVATPTHVFPCVFYQHRSIDIHCTRIKEPPKVVEISELCDRCAPPQTVRLGSSSFGKERLQIGKLKDTRKNKENREFGEGLNRDETIASFSRDIHASLKVGREKREAESIAIKERRANITGKETKDPEQHQEDVESLILSLAKSRISANAVEQKNINNEKAKKEQTLQLQISEPSASTTESIATPQEIESKDLKGKARGWVNVNPEDNSAIFSIGNGEPFTRFSVLQRLFGKREVARKEAGETREQSGREAGGNKKVQKDGSWAQVNDDPTWEGDDEEWEDVERVAVSVNNGFEEREKR